MFPSRCSRRSWRRTVVESMEQRWLELWNRLGARGDPHYWFKDLAGRYGDPDRRYHTLRFHIQPCLIFLEAHPALARDPNAVGFALWYHDAMDDENQSAAYAVQVTIEIGLPEAFSQAVADLILATKHTSEVPIKPDGRLIADIDLMILGQPEDVFDDYEERIREEYSWVPERTFRNARAAILRPMLDRPFIYATSYFRSRYEAQARRNVTKSLGLLESTRTP